MLRFIQSLLLAIWFGGGLLLMTVAAPAAFRHAPDRSIAGDIVGDMLSRWRLLALLIPLALLAIDFAVKRSRARTVMLILASVLAASQMLVDARVHQMRAESPVAISSLAPGHPVRRQFGMLHGASSILMLSHIILGAGVLFTLSREART